MLPPVPALAVMMGFTTWDGDSVEDDVAKYVLPGVKVAVMVCVPAVNAEVLTCAVPLDKVIVPSDAPLSVNATVPVGAPPPLVGVTVAVKVTEFPYVDGLDDDVIPVVVGAAVIVWVTAGDVDTPNCALPLYVAVIECCPPPRVNVL
jgi:hypothetical protein